MCLAFLRIFLWNATHFCFNICRNSFCFESLKDHLDVCRQFGNSYRSHRGLGLQRNQEISKFLCFRYWTLVTSHLRVSSYSEFQMPSQTVAAQGEAKLYIPDFKTKWSEFRCPLECCWARKRRATYTWFQNQHSDWASGTLTIWFCNKVYVARLCLVQQHSDLVLLCKLFGQIKLW